jgi:hypothetical protein
MNQKTRGRGGGRGSRRALPSRTLLSSETWSEAAGPSSLPTQNSNILGVVGHLQEMPLVRSFFTLTQKIPVTFLH